MTSALDLTWDNLLSAIVDQREVLAGEEVSDLCSLLMLADRVLSPEKLSILRRRICSPCVSPNLGSPHVLRTALISRASCPTTYSLSSI